MSARYQACCLNYNLYVKELFGEHYGIDDILATACSSRPLREQLAAPRRLSCRRVYDRLSLGSTAALPQRSSTANLRIRMLFVPKLVGKAGQADEVIEFLKPDSEVAKSINRDYFAFKEVERPKYLPIRSWS